MAGVQNRNDVDVPLLATMGVLGAILLVVIVVGTQAWFQYEQDKELTRKVLNTTNPALERLYTEQTSHLRGGRWADADRQWATIRIERAMDLIVKRYAEDRMATATDEQG